MVLGMVFDGIAEKTRLFRSILEKMYNYSSLYVDQCIDRFGPELCSYML